MTTVLSPVLKQRFYDNNGNPLVGGKVFSYQAGTTTKLATYTDSTGNTSNANPTILNARGEADIWIPPNVAYKFVLAPSTDSDPPTSPIWTEDQVVNSQLITLYGGVDTGSTNAYILNFTANFSAYQDGILIYWIPSHTNTSGSTINVNGLGVVNVTNADGSALAQSAIIQNQPATIMYKGGAFILVSATTTVYGTFPPIYTGFSVNPSLGNIPWRKNGTLCTIIFPAGTGTSNSNFFQIGGLPSIITPNAFTGTNVPCIGFMDNGALVAGGLAVVRASTQDFIFYKDGTQPNWTASGSKGFAAPTTITYSL